MTLNRQPPSSRTTLSSREVSNNWPCTDPIDIFTGQANKSEINSVFHANRLDEVASAAESNAPSSHLNVKNKLLRQLAHLENPSNFEYAQKNRTQFDKIPNPKGFLGLKKGSKPSRFNEDLADSASQTRSITISQYLSQANGIADDVSSSRKLKVNLRSINTAAERDNLRKL